MQPEGSVIVSAARSQQTVFKANTEAKKSDSKIST
jgi:hypothetical protein